MCSDHAERLGVKLTSRVRLSICNAESVASCLCVAQAVCLGISG